MARTPAPRRLGAALALLLALGPGCKELSQTFEEAEQQTEQTRIGGSLAQQEALRKRRQARAERPDFDMEKKKKEWGGVDLPANSPEQRLKEAIIQRLECEDRFCSKQALKEIRAQADFYEPGLPKLFERQGPEVTLEALRLAGLLKAASAINALGMVAVKGEGKVRKEAIWALGAIEDPAAIPELERLIETGVGWEARSDVCSAFTSIGHRDALKTLQKLIRDEHPDVRAECARAMGATQSAEAVEPLASLIRDGESKVIQAAVTGLGKIEGSKAKAAKVQLQARLEQLKKR